MNEKRSFSIALLVLCLIPAFFSNGHTQTKPDPSTFRDPLIRLASFEVPQYDGFWYFSKKVAPTKGDVGDRGAPLPLSFLFDIRNPNPYPILLEGFRFTVAFDRDFEVVTLNNQDAYWIPAGMSDQVRVNTMITVRSALLSLLVTGGYKLRDRGWNAWQALERWWKGVPEYAVPVTVMEGAAIFSADNVTRVIPFEGTSP
jgi:hypothetical protein